MVRPLLSAFFVGVASFLIARLWFSGNESTIAGVVTATIAVLIIVLLGFHYYHRPATDLRLAGDNLYYLGLLFTLASLIMALVQLFVFQMEDDDLRQRTHALIGNFGIALFSTVTGILGRILLQSLNDEKDGERGKRPVGEHLPSVSASVTALRQELRESTDAFSHFTRVTQSQAEQVKVHSERLIREFNDRMSTVAERGLADVMTSWRKSVEAIAADSENLAKHIDNKMSEATTRAETAWRGLAQDIAAVSESARLRLATDAAEMARMLEQLAAANQALGSLAAGLEVAERSTRSLGTTATNTAARLDDRATEIVAAYNALVHGAKEFQEVGLEKYREAISEFMEVARTQLAQEGAKWLESATAITESAEARLDQAKDDAEAVKRLGERISEESERSLAVVEQFRNSLERAVHGTTVPKGRDAPVLGVSRWFEATWNMAKRLMRKG